MAAYPIYAGYTVWFTDPGEYAIARLITGGTTFYINPVDAADIFGITYPVATYGDYPPESFWTGKGIFSNFYSLQLPGTNVFNPIDSGIPLAPNVDSVLVPDVTGNPPIFSGTVAEVIWYGRLLFLPPANPSVLVPQRRWIGGNELSALGEGGSSLSFSSGCRDSSRTIEGLGMSFRGGNGTAPWLRTFSEYLIPNQQSTWERFYVRLLAAASNGPHVIWRSFGSINPNIGFVVSIDGSSLVFSQSNSVGTLVTISSVAINLGQWQQIDLLFGYYGGPLPPTGNVPYIGRVNKQIVCTGNSVTMVIQQHTSSQLGKAPGADITLQLDIDDWSCMDFSPYNDAGAFFGTHMRYLRNASLASSVGWTTTPQTTNQGHNSNQAQNASSTSTTAGALLQANVDYPTPNFDNAGILLGEISALVSSFNSNSAGTDGTLGISAVGGFLSQTTAIDQGVVAAFNNIFLRPFGLLNPLYFGTGGFTISHNKSGDANTDSSRNLSVVVEQVGMWNTCDDYTGTFEEPANIRHNAYFPNTPWALGGPNLPPPVSPVFAVGGTYVGNGTEVIVSLPAPFQFLWIRALTGGSAGVKWFGSGLGGHPGITDKIVPSYITRAWYDNTTRLANFAIAGTDPECNAVGVTYQYIAFCDPGMRFNLCGAYNPIPAVANPINLIDGEYTPTFAFNQADKPGINSAVVGLSITGPGFTLGAGQYLDGTNIVSWGTLTKGLLLVGSNLAIAQNGQSNYSLWRSRDASCGYVMVQITSYVGNNTNPRVIPLTPTSGRVPLFVMVVPHGSPGFMRDPSHAGANSCGIGNLSNSASAIVAVGVDQITVQSSLNANGVIHEVFAICGDTAGMLNGTYYPPGCVPSFGPDGPWDIPPVDPAAIAIIGEGGVEVGEEGATTKLSLLRDISGIYTIIDGKTSDTLYDRQPAQTSADHAIPNPFWETGYIGG